MAATVIPFIPRHTTSPLSRTISDGLEAVALQFAKMVYDANYVSEAQIRAALSQPVSMAAVLDDVARWFGVEVPPIVEESLS